MPILSLKHALSSILYLFIFYDALSVSYTHLYGCALEDVDLPDGIIYTQDYHEVINDEDVDVVVELIGGTTIAKKIIKRVFFVIFPHSFLIPI